MYFKGRLFCQLTKSRSDWTKCKSVNVCFNLDIRNKEVSYLRKNTKVIMKYQHNMCSKGSNCSIKKISTL